MKLAEKKEKDYDDNCLHGSLSHHNPGQTHSEVTAGAWEIRKVAKNWRKYNVL